MLRRLIDDPIYYQRRLRLALARLGRPKKRPDALAAMLGHLGVQPGRIVLVHSSLSAVQAACDISAGQLLDMLRNLLTPAGTLAMPVFPFTGSVAAYLDTLSQPTDIRSLPSQTGLLTEMLRRSPEAEHSLHPTHAVVAVGARAKWLTGAHLDDDQPFGPHSPYQRLCDAKGLLLGLGVDYRAFASFHLADALTDADRPNRSMFGPVQHVECIDAQQGQWTQAVRPLRPNVPRCVFRHYLNLRRSGAARSQNVRGQPFVSIEAQALPATLGRLQQTGQSPASCGPFWRFMERCYLANY
ncbi:MAG: AAC(3) family N-acetyltransferase [Phycisphaerae bacterium]